MRVLVCGDRNWSDLDCIQTFLYFLGPNDTVIHGGAKGADSLGSFVGMEQGCSDEMYPAEWEKYGKRAGPIRNQRMLTEGKPDIVVAFHNDLSKSKGTKDMVARAIQANIPTYVISGNGGIQERVQSTLDPEQQVFLEEVRQLLIGDEWS